MYTSNLESLIVETGSSNSKVRHTICKSGQKSLYIWIRIIFLHTVYDCFKLWSHFWISDTQTSKSVIHPVILLLLLSVFNICYISWTHLKLFSFILCSRLENYKRRHLSVFRFFWDFFNFYICYNDLIQYYYLTSYGKVIHVNVLIHVFWTSDHPG